MTEDKSNQFSDDAIRRFLFGRLSAAEQTILEEHLFTDDALEARVRLAEFDLADEYALERLSAVDREAFAEKFLLSAERQRQLSVSTALRDRFASALTGENTARYGAKASIRDRLQLLFGLNQRAWRLAFGVTVLAVLVAAAWLVLKESRIRPAINPPPIVRSSPSPDSKRETAHPPGPTSPPEHHLTPSPMPPHQLTVSPAILSVDLFSNASRNRDQMPSIDLPKGEHDIVRLQLALKLNRARSYRADLLTVEGQNIFSSQALQSIDTDARKVDLDVPAALLKTGDYQVGLYRADDGSKKTVASYYFRVQ
jgi:anti-sigma factor RsiW